MIPKEKPRWLVYAAVEELSDLVIVDCCVEGKNVNAAIKEALKNNHLFEKTYTIEGYYASKLS